MAKSSVVVNKSQKHCTFLYIYQEGNCPVTFNKFLAYIIKRIVRQKKQLKQKKLQLYVQKNKLKISKNKFIVKISSSMLQKHKFNEYEKTTVTK